MQQKPLWKEEFIENAELFDSLKQTSRAFPTLLLITSSMDFKEEFREKYVKIRDQRPRLPIRECVSLQKATANMCPSLIKDGKIIISSYYFPLGTKTVNVCDVKCIKYARQCDSYAKNWGSNGLTWWACDMKRNFREHSEEYYNVSVDNGECFDKGFTVKDIVGFQRALRNDLKGCSIEKLETL